MSWLKTTPILQSTVHVINKIDETKFPLLLSRLFNFVPTTESQHPFSQEELQKLEKSLKISNTDLKNIIESLLLIIKSSKQFIIKPTVLQEELINNLKFSTEKTEIFVKLWTENVKEDFEDFEKRVKLQNCTWELNLETATDKDLKTTTPTSVLQFQIKDNEEQSKFVTFQINEQKLLILYDQIERIQNTLDNIKEN